MNGKTNVRTGILLIAHGSRRERANDELRKLAERVRERVGDDVVEFAYLELAEPTIPAGAGRCIAAGVDRVLLLPYFLSDGEHVCRDLEQYRRDLADAFPNVEFQLCPPLGLHPLIVDIVLDRIEEGRQSARPGPKSGSRRGAE